MADQSDRQGAADNRAERAAVEGDYDAVRMGHGPYSSFEARKSAHLRSERKCVRPRTTGDRASVL